MYTSKLSISLRLYSPQGCKLTKETEMGRTVSAWFVKREYLRAWGAEYVPSFLSSDAQFARIPAPA